METRIDEQRVSTGYAVVSLPAQGWPVPSLSDLAFLIPILVLFWCTTGVGWLLVDSDTGWHIRTGEWILTNGRVPATDIFSFTMDGEPWFAWEWLSDVLMAAVHHFAGLGGIVLASLVLLGATAVCVYRNAFAESRHRMIAIVLTSLAMAASTIHWLARPHLVTPLITAVFLWFSVVRTETVHPNFSCLYLHSRYFGSTCTEASSSASFCSSLSRWELSVRN